MTVTAENGPKTTYEALEYVTMRELGVGHCIQCHSLTESSGGRVQPYDAGMVCPTCKAYTVYGLSRAADLGMIRVVEEADEVGE